MNGDQRNARLQSALKRPRLIFFTGLGCDERMIAPHRAIDADIEFVPWIMPRAAESLAAYSARLIEGMDFAAPFYLAGISLGAMVAQEVARLHRPRGLILLSSCRSSQGIPFSHRLLADVCAASPLWFIHLAKTIVPHMRQLFGIGEAGEVDLFEKMMSAAPDELIRWSLHAVTHWRGGGNADVPTFQVHGERDRILPLNRAGPVDVAIEGAGHAVSVTHAAAVNAAINRWLATRDVIQRSIGDEGPSGRGQ